MAHSYIHRQKTVTFLYRVLVTVALAASNSSSVDAAAHTGGIFSGGMALQAGYVRLENRYGTARGVMSGLGGRLHFYFGDHIRLGGGGASVKLSYRSSGLDGSFIAIGYGGVTVEASLPHGRWRGSLGVLAGGALVTTMHLIDGGEQRRYSAWFDRDGSFLITPLVTIERKMTDAISLMIMGDFLWSPALGERYHIGGPKLHLGILFNK